MSSWSSQNMDGQTLLYKTMDHAIQQRCFTNLMEEYTLIHASSLHYPQLNGLTEKFVQIVKNLFYKAKDEGTDLFHCLMIYHTPHKQAIYNFQCRSYKVDLLDHSCPCPMQQ